MDAGAQAEQGKGARGEAPPVPRAVPAPWDLRAGAGLALLPGAGRGGAARPPSGSAAGPSGARDVQPGREPAQQEAAALR